MRFAAIKSKHFIHLPVWIVSLLAILGLDSSANAQGLATFSGPTMGTRYTVQLTDRDDLAAIQTMVEERLSNINRLMSTYDEKSELSSFNQHSKTDWFAVSKETALVVKFALQVAAETDGAFDPTVGPAVNLWGFGPEGRRKKPPNNAEIEKARKRIGYQKLEAQLEPPALRKQTTDMYVDLSAVAKGYAVDEISDLLAKNDCESSLVVIGGEIRARDKKPDGTYWRIGIEEPTGMGRPFERVVQVESVALATSGDWRNAFDHQGVRYAHVIDPSTAKPVGHNVAGVTVLADRSIESDARATGLLVMGDERGIAWCEEHKVAAIFFVRRENGKIIARASTHLAKRVIP
jgi:FAD:protein FMN transferase